MQINNIQSNIPESLITIPIQFDQLKIDEKKIGYSIGYPNGDLPVHSKELISDIFLKLNDKCEIKCGFKIEKLIYEKNDKYGLTIGNKFFGMDKIVTSQLKKSDYAALFVCTIGPEMEKWSKDVSSDGDLMFGYLIDTVASTTTELVADFLHDQIKEYAGKYGMKITNRYSPGYCNWNVSEQQKLFSFFPKGFCGVELSESSLMHPIKSVSGVIGIGANVKYSEYLCDRCGIKDCTHRVYLSRRKQNS